MVTIGNTKTPGTLYEINSARTTGATLQSPAVPFIIGQGYLSDGESDPDTAHKITRSNQARAQFGSSENSMLTTAVQDAIAEGANPVYAVAPSENDVTGEDLSGITGNTGTLSNSPVLEVADDIVFTVDSSQKETVLYYEGDPDNASPDTDEVYLNPVSGKFNSGEGLGNSGDSVDYTWLDYADTFDAITETVLSNDEYPREIADLLVLLQEKDSIVQLVRDKAEDMEADGWFNIGVAGAGEPYILDSMTGTDEVSNYSHTYNTSRLQLVSPTRGPDGETLLGAYAGVKARVGIEATPIHEYFQNTYKNTVQRYSQGQKEKLVAENVVPLEPTSNGVKIKEDMTTVEDGNLEEANWKQATARLITDFASENIAAASDPFIGQFNNPGVQGNVESAAQSVLNTLLGQRSLDAYSLDVIEASATEIILDVGLDTADPLRNIRIRVTAGAVQGGVTIENL